MTGVQTCALPILLTTIAGRNPAEAARTVSMAAEQSDVVRANLNDLKMADVDKNSLIDFYRALPEGSEDLNLGMYYISYLNDACEKVNVRFAPSSAWASSPAPPWRWAAADTIFIHTCT